MEPLPADERFESLFRAHARSLLGYALRRVDRPEDAADVVADTMLVAWRHVDEVPGGAEARPWLFGVARRVLANRRRGGRRRDRLGERLRRELGRVTVPDHAAAVETTVVVREALARLDPDDREVLQLTSWEGLAPAEIALAMGVPPATVRTRLHRARQRLRQHLGIHVEPGEASALAADLTGEIDPITDVRGQPAWVATLQPGADQPGDGGEWDVERRRIFWQEAPGVVAIVETWGTDYDVDVLRDVAESLRPATDPEWAEMQVATGAAAGFLPQGS